jgi:hypothetical protein
MYFILLQATFDVKCGGVITGKPSGQIVSPGFPQLYDANLHCNYTIDYPDRYINLEFTSFDLESVYCSTHFHISIQFLPATHSINLSYQQ